MCELLGLSAKNPTDICFSFTGLIARGGGTGRHKDGWGIAFYKGKGCRLIIEPNASVNSKLAHFLKSYPIHSNIVISHIRRATYGKIALENTHPFFRELWGLSWVYAHNGNLRGVQRKLRSKLKFYQPIGSTDSELAFCWILDQLRLRFKTRPSDKKLFQAIREVCLEIRQYGVFNLLLSDSKFLYCFCSNKLHYIERGYPFGKLKLKDSDLEVDFAKLTSKEDKYITIATQPLTINENWVKMERNSFKVFKSGELYWQ